MSGTLRLRGATSGYSELQAPAVAADQTFVLPTAGGTLLTTDSPVPKLTLELGSASQPSLTFEGDTDTGLYSSGTNTLNLVTGGSDSLIIDSSGKIGVGTTPSTLLHIQSTDPAFRFKRSDAGTDAYGELTTDTSGLVTIKSDPANAAAGSGFRITVDNTERLRIDSSGNVGIGLTNISGSGSLTLLAGQNLKWAGSGGNTIYGDIYASDQHNLIFRTNNSNERMRIDSSGRLLVGLTSSSQIATQILQGSSFGSSDPGILYLARGTATPSASQTIGSIRFSDNTHTASAVITAARDGGTWSASSKPTYLSFQTTANGASSSTERMRIDSSGKVGIGNSSPSSYFGGANDLVVGGSGSNGITVVSGSTSAGNLFFADGTGTGDHSRGIIQYTHSDNSLRFSADSVERMRIPSGGGLSIGATTNPNCLTQSSAVRLNQNTVGSHAITNVSTTATNISASSGVGGLAFVQLYNTANGSQYVGIIMWRANVVSVVSESNATGLAINFSTSGSTLRLATGSGTVSGSIITLQG